MHSLNAVKQLLEMQYNFKLWALTSFSHQITLIVTMDADCNLIYKGQCP